MPRIDDIEVIINGEDNSRGAFKTFNGSMTKMGEIAGGILIANVFGKLTESIKGFAFGALQGAKDLEQLEISFTTMLGDADKAKKLINEITEAAKATPFELPELQRASKSLLAFGIEADDIIPTLIRLGDVSSGIGIRVEDIAEIYGKARVQGRLFAEDINQLTGRGIPIIAQFAKQLGVAESEVKGLVEQGIIGFPQLEQAFKDMTGEGGQFEGLMAAQSESLAGIQSNIADTINVMSTDIIRESGLFDIIKQGATEFLEFITNNKDEIKSFFTDFVDGLKDGAKFAQEFLTPIFTWIKENPALVEGIVKFTVAFVALKTAIALTNGFMISFITKVTLLTLRAITMSVSFATATGQVGLFGASLGAVTLGIGGMITLAAALGAAWVVAISDMIGKINEAEASLKKASQTRMDLQQRGADVTATKKQELVASGELSQEQAGKIRDIQDLSRFLNAGVIPSFAQGGDFITNGPQAIMVGDNPSGQERVTVTPLGEDGGGGMTLNLTINASDIISEGNLIQKILDGIGDMAGMQGVEPSELLNMSTPL